MYHFISRLKISHKLTLIFILFIAPLYLISLLMNESGSQTLKQELANSMYSKVEYYMDTIDYEFERIIKQEYDLSYDDDLSKLSVLYSVMSNIERMQSILRLDKRLDTLKNSNRYVKNVSVYIREIETTITTAASSSSSTMPKDDFFTSPLSERYDTPLRLWGGRMFLSIPFPDQGFLGNLPGPSFVIHVEIDTKALQHDLGYFVSHEVGGTVFADMKGEWLITDLNAEPSPYEMLDHLEDMPFIQDSDGTGIVTISDEPYMIAYKKSSALGAILFTHTPVDIIMAPIDKYKRWYWLLSLVSLVVIIIFSYMIYGLIHRPLVRLLQSFRRVENGNLERIGTYRFQDEFSYLYNQFNKMIDKLQVLIHEVYEHRYRTQLAELRQLQSQINPHFFYNSFFILYRMAKSEDYESIMRMTKHLGEYYRFITRDGNDIITLRQEEQFTRNYVEVQNIRFSRRIKLDFPPLPDEYAELPIPRLTLQPIFENAYSHGLEKKSADGSIQVSYTSTPSSFSIIIEDNGDGLEELTLTRMRAMINSPESTTESTGLINVHRRMRIHYGSGGGLTLSRSESGGLKVTITIPKEESRHVSTTDRG